MHVYVLNQSAAGCDWAHRHAGTLVDKVNCDPLPIIGTIKVADVALNKNPLQRKSIHSYCIS